ncbi:MAG: DUF3473 domain-containing protein [Leptospirales bacterium]
MNTKIACISIDVEKDPGRPGQVPLLFSDNDKLNRLINLFSFNSLPLTAFVVMGEASLFKEGLGIIAESCDVELGVHSYSHDQRHSATNDEIHRSFECFRELWGYPPLGYRAPNTLIDHDGLSNLLECGFYYDSSIVPSIRFDEYGYNNIHYPRTPFIFEKNGKRLVELPVATLAGIRLPLTFSYLKLLGFQTYRALSSLMPLPNQICIYLHPYDLYTHECDWGFQKSWKRLAHLHNSYKAFDILEKLIAMLIEREYQFVTMSTLADLVTKQIDIQCFPIESS